MLRSRFSFLIFCLFFSFQAYAATQANKFVYLKSNEVNLRSGPDGQHPIVWTIRNKGEPLKVLETFYQWLNVKTIAENKGWVQSPMVSIRYMYGVVVNETKKPVIGYAMNSSSSRKIVRLEPGVRLRVLKCNDTKWCKIRINTFTAWIPQKNLWGINF